MALFAQAQAQKGTVINEEAYVYSLPDFDSPIVGVVKIGEVYDMSKGKKEAFYKIRLKPGTVVWIADNDIRPGVIQDVVDAAANAKKPGKKTGKKTAEKKRPHRAFDKTRFRGPVVEMLQFKESTLGGQRSESFLMYGLKVAGPNTVFDGDMDTEANFIFHMGAPKYYNEFTSNSANGWMFMGNFLFENVTVGTANYNYYFGFGPVLKYSHFELGLTNTSTGRTTNYSADDIAIGAIFNFGIALKVSDYALRLDAKYYWEKEAYLAGGLSFLFPF